jgi:hypothetical protein
MRTELKNKEEITSISDALNIIDEDNHRGTLKDIWDENGN